MILSNKMLSMIENEIIRKKMFQSYAFHLIINMLIFSILAFILPIRFEVNDDILMLTIASGNYLPSAPDAHLVFINYIYGLLVSSLYNLYDGLEWYTILFVIIHIVSWSIISWSVFKKEVQLIIKILASFVFLSFEVYCILFFQFTTTAAVCAISGIILFFSSDVNKWRYIAVILFFIGSLIRFDAAFLVLLLSLPFFLKELFVIEKGHIRKYILVCLLFVLLPFTAKLIDSKIYESDEDWKYFKEYNYYRGQINDNPNAYHLQDFPIGIIEADHLLLIRFFPDCNILNLDVIKDIWSRIDNVGLEKKINNLIPNTIKYKYYILSILLLSLSVLLLQTKNRDRFIVAMIPALLLFAIIFVSLSATLKERVFVSMLLPVSWGLFSMFVYSKKHKTTRSCVLPFCLSVFFIICFYQQDIKAGIEAREKEVNYYKKKTLDIIDYLRTFEEGYTMQYRSCLSLHRLSPFKISEYSKGYKTASLGWLSHIPFNKNVFESYKDIIDKNLVLVNKDQVDMLLEPLEKSILYHYGFNIEPMIVYETDFYYLIRLEQTKD